VTANAGADLSIVETTSTTLDASGSTISVGGGLSFLWEQLSGPTATIASPSAESTSITAPAVDAESTLVFQVTVGSSCDADKVDTVSVVVTNNLPPNADAGPDQSNIEIGQVVTLNGSNSSDPEAGNLSYAWVESSAFSVSLSDATAASPTFNAPNGGLGGGALTFELTVTDALGESDTDTVIVNVDSCAPTAAAGPDQTVELGDVFTLDASNSADSCSLGGIATYLWVQDSGTASAISDASASTTMVTAPSEIGALVYELTVTDTDGFSDSDTVTVNVVDIIPVDLTCDAGPDQNVSEGDLVSLSGANSMISDGTISAYMWAHTAASSNSSLTLTSPDSVDTSFIAPDVGVDQSEAFTLTLTCTSDEGLMDTDTVIVNVGDVNTPPTANAGADQSAIEGDSVMLDGTGSADADGDVISYLWAQTSGPAVTLDDTTAASPTFNAPATNANGESLVFELTVSDGEAMNSDTVIVSVSFINEVPVANAGPEQNVNEGARVTLSAVGSSDPDGQNLTYIWTQVSGAQVTLTAPQFTTPAIDADAVLVFEVTVSDGTLIATDRVTINVANSTSSGGGSNGGGSGGSGSSGGSSGGGGGSFDYYLALAMMLLMFGALRQARLTRRPQ